MVFGGPIPGETPIDDISGLKINGITTREELNKVEAENIRRAITKYLAGIPNRRTARFDLSWTLRLHREMFGDVWKWAGSLRKSDLSIGMPWPNVETNLYTLLENLKCWETEQRDILEQAVWLHHRAVFIHPFQNGNGRWARLIANIWLRLHKAATVDWPEVTIGSTSQIREEYLVAIRKADNGEYQPLLDLHRWFQSS